MRPAPGPLGMAPSIPGQACPPLSMLPSSSFPSSLVDHLSSLPHQLLHHPRLPKPIPTEPPPPSVHLHCAEATCWYSAGALPSQKEPAFNLEKDPGGRLLSPALTLQWLDHRKAGVLEKPPGRWWTRSGGRRSSGSKTVASQPRMSE